jgi:hypothetical protein
MKSYRFYLLILFFVVLILAIASISSNSVTVDEFTHVPVGLSQLSSGKFNMEMMNPPLVRLWAAVPLLFLTPRLHLESGFQNIDYVLYARQFMLDNHDRYHVLIMVSRFMILLLLIPLGVLVWNWTKKDYGAEVGVAALFLLFLNPNILAHATLATTDLGITVIFFATVFSIKKFAENPGWKFAIILGITLGLAQCAKFTGLLIYPILFVGLTVAGIKSKSLSIKKLILMGVSAFGISILIINMVYCFQLTGTPLGYFEFRSSWFTLLKSGLPASTPVPLPYFYLTGIDAQIAESAGFDNYLNGMLSPHGWWHYYIFALLIKNPIPFLLLLGTGIILYFKKTTVKNYDWLLFLPLLQVLFFFSINTTKNIGLRFILPIYPFLAIIAAQSIRIQIPYKRLIFGILALWYLIACFYIAPNFIAYFNEFVGGPSQGYRYLLDSNLDWGQDLIRFKKYLTQHHIEQIPFSHFGPVDPTIYGINVLPLTSQPQSGLVAVSVNNLYGISLVNKTEFDWLRKYQPIDKAGYSIFIYDISTTK